MRTLTDEVYQLIEHMSPKKAIALISERWNFAADAQLSHARFIDERQPTAPGIILTALEVAQQLQFETWIRCELGENGRRAFYYAMAKLDHLEPTSAEHVGAKDTPSQRALAYVAEQCDVGGDDPIETVRKSVQRFKLRCRQRPIFNFKPSTGEIKFVNGISFLRSLRL